MSSFIRFISILAFFLNGLSAVKAAPCVSRTDYSRTAPGSTWTVGLPRAVTEAFDIFQTPSARVHIKSYRASVVEPGSENVFIHGMYDNKMMIWKIDGGFRCSLAWMRDTADFEYANTPTIIAMRVDSHRIHTVGYRHQQTPDMDNPLCRFSIGIGADTSWSLFSVNQLRDSSEIAKYPSFYYPLFYRFEPYWYLIHVENNTFKVKVLDDSGRVVKAKSYISDSTEMDGVGAEGLFRYSDGTTLLVGSLADLTFLTIGSPPRPSTRTYFCKLNGSLDTVWQRLITLIDSGVNVRPRAIYGNSRGHLVSPVRYLQRTAHLTWPGLIVLDSNGNTLINRQYKDLMDFNLYGSMATKDGDVVVYGSKGPLDPVGNSPLTSKGYAFAARLSAKTGDIQWLNVYDDSANIGSVFTTGCITESGRIILAGQLQGKFLYCGIRDSVLITSVDDERADAGVHAPDLAVSPVPTRDILTAALRGVQAEACRFSIYDMAGRELLSSTAPVTDSSCTVTLSTASLPAGSYVLRCTAGRTAASQTIVIQR